MTPAQSRRLGRAVLIATLILLVAVPFILATWRLWAMAGGAALRMAMTWAMVGGWVERS